MNSAFVGYLIINEWGWESSEELWRSKAEFNNSFIIHSK